MTCCEAYTGGNESLSGRWKDLLAAFTRRITSIPRIIAIRREVRKLEEFDDHQLRDIGLHRADIRASLSCGYLDDPSGFLWERIHQSRGPAGGRRGS